MIQRLHRSRRPTSDVADVFDEQLLRKLEYLHIFARRLAMGRNRAEHRSKKIGSGIEFADHRDYAPGDDVRYIDWNVLGRTDRLLLRLFEQEEDLSIHLLLDVSSSMRLGRPTKLGYAMQTAAALAYIGLAGLDRVGLVTFAGEVQDRLPAARGKARIFKVFEFLRSVQTGGVTDLSASVRTFVHEHKRRGIAILLSDLYDMHGFETAVDLLRHHRFEPLVVQIYDRTEASPELSGDLRLEDCETGTSLDLTVSSALLARYRQRYEALCRKLEDYCRSKQVPFFRADTRIPFDDLVLKVLRRRKFLG